MAKRKVKARADDASEVTLTRPDDIESTPQGVVRRWLAELNVADAAEESWRKESLQIWKTYEAEQVTANSFNILWSNTEILSAAVYNSTPQPDVRRRFRDADPVGKAVSTVLERSLSYEIDDYDFNGEIGDSVLDLLICGRGVVRIKYEPKFVQVTEQGTQLGTPAGAYQQPPAEGMKPPAERLADQHVPCEHVQWDKFRRGPGKRWRDLPWIAFEHEFTMEMAEEKFGPEIARALTYSQGQDTERASSDKQVREIFKVCVVHEIWDKDKRRVLFIAPTYRAQPCLEVPDPLHLKEFWPMPRPAYAVQNSRKLEPTPLYRLYREQANELDRVSARINKIVNALRVRGAYNAALPELANVIESDDNTMTPVANTSAIADQGGLDKAIWLMPVEKLIQVLKGLYESRDQIKQTIYEIVGIADILRGATDPNETARAQSIKSKWGSIRVQKLQREIQRMVRDLMRLKAEVIAEQFTPQQLSAITSVQLPTAQQKQQAQLAAQQAQQTGQPLPPDIEKTLSAPSWDEVMAVMRSDQLRSYRIDIETDSTVAETIDRDTQGLAEVAQAVGGVLGAVSQGLPIETAKEFALAMVRRARLGSAVEDAIDKIPGQEDQMQQFAQQVMQLIQQEGGKQAQSMKQAEQQQAGLQQYDQQIQQTLGEVGQAAQVSAQTAAQSQQAAQVNGQVLQQLGQILQQMGAANNEAMTQVAAALQGVQQQTQQVTAGLAEVLKALKAPKRINFTRGTDNRISGATAS